MGKRTTLKKVVPKAAPPPPKPQKPRMVRRAKITDTVSKVEMAARIKARRTELDMSQHDLADGIGVTWQQVQKYEQGRTTIAISRLQDIAKVLKVPLGYFYDGFGHDGEVDSMARDTAPTNMRLLVAYNGITDISLRRAFVVMIEHLARISEKRELAPGRKRKDS